MPISVMVKPSSSNCNLACKYCFYHSLSSLRKDFSKGYMSEDTAKNLIESALSFADSTDVFFTFQGGEPLLSGIEFLKKFVLYAKEKNTKNSKISFCMQTNGTLINDEWCEFFKENDFLVGVSLDGDENCNAYRITTGGKSSFDEVLNGIKLLKKHGIQFNVLSVVTKELSRNIRSSYRFFKQNNIRYVQYIPCLKPFGSQYDKSLYMDSEDYSYFVEKAFKLYYNDNMRGEFFSVRQFDNYVSLASGNPAEQCGMNGMCSSQFVVEGDGSVYPCDFYCTDEWLLGNINETGFSQLYNSPKALEFVKESFKVDEKCKQCDYFTLCRGGGCKRNKVNTDYCGAYKKFFGEYSYQLLQLKGGR